MTDAIEHDYTEIYTQFYRCSKCNCTDILAHHHYCPSCGEKIIEFKPKCQSYNSRKAITCELKEGHTGLHKNLTTEETWK